MVDLADRYVIRPNRESGFGRYDLMLEPRTELRPSDDYGITDHNRRRKAFIIEFKVQSAREKELSDTVQEALRQIEEKQYQADLVGRGIPEECLRKYGFAFCGKKVLIGNGTMA